MKICFILFQLNDKRRKSNNKKKEKLSLNNFFLARVDDVHTRSKSLTRTLYSFAYNVHNLFCCIFFRFVTFRVVVLWATGMAVAKTKLKNFKPIIVPDHYVITPCVYFSKHCARESSKFAFLFYWHPWSLFPFPSLSLSPRKQKNVCAITFSHPKRQASNMCCVYMQKIPLSAA